MAHCSHSDLVKKKKIIFFWCLTYQTDVAVCVSVTPLKIGAKHRRSRRPCWRAGPMTTWLTLTITWTIWGTTGPTLWSTSPSWICANSQKHTAGGRGGHAHRCTLQRCCHFSMLDATRCAAQKCSTCSPCPIQRPVCRREPALHWPITLLSQEQALLMHCWHASTLKGEDETIRQWCLINANF